MDYLAYGYLGLFAVCFLAATILPFSSEGILILALSLDFDPYICLILASFGNTFGGVTNYFIGRIGKPQTLKRFFPSSEKFNRIHQRVEKHGVKLALLSWVPIIGDPLVIVLGFLRIPFLPVLILMFISKAIRYAIIIFWMNW